MHVDSNFIECINSLLSGGEVTGLYSPSEIENIQLTLQDQIGGAGFFGGVHQFFLSRLRANLHVVVIMNPRNSDFLIRCQTNPSLYSRCSIQWWDKWPAEVMSYLPSVILNGVLDSKKISELIDQILQIQTTIEVRGSSPRTFLSLVEAFKKIYTAKSEQSRQELLNLRGGLAKLAEASGTVETLTRDAKTKQDKLTHSRKQADNIMKQIEDKMKSAAASQHTMHQLTESLAVDRADASQKRDAIAAQLSKIQPILDNARSSVNSISKRTIEDLRAFRAVAPTIMDIMEGVVLLLGGKEISWNAFKVFLGQPEVLNKIVNFDPANVKLDNRLAVERILEERKSSFESKNALHASSLALPLAEWVKAVVTYSAVKHKIAPLEAELAQANKRLDTTENRFKALEVDIQRLNQEIENIRMQHQEITQEAMRFQLALEETEKVLGRSSSLVEQLKVEASRWSAREHSLLAMSQSLPTASLLAAAFVTYMGCVPEDIRAELVARWKEITGYQSWSFTQFMGTETDLVKMRNNGLPSDDLSAENALITQWSPLVPFIIDPSSTSIGWLGKHLGEKVEIMTQDDPRFVHKLELALRFGRTLLIQEVDNVHPILIPILRKHLMRQGPQLTVQIGEKLVNYSEEFKMFLATRHPQPDLPPDVRPLVCEVNFTVTKSGLENQLLGVVLLHEMPDLEQKRVQALVSEEKNKMQLASLENQLLSELAKAKGDILESQELITTLKNTKSMSVEIEEALSLAHNTQATLEKERNGFRPIAKAGSDLFFALADLCKA
ncbi:cytoplasmic dynein 2 heavy chain 1 [Pelomyxa schiedti]|nr:cytoplasmic dynein 2 heavy chain 1 [Pelomyxa schiedti]